MIGDGRHKISIGRRQLGHTYLISCSVVGEVFFFQQIVLLSRIDRLTI